MIEPKLWFARAVSGAGSDLRGHSLACIVTHFGTEGSCVYEQLDANGNLKAVENGTWRLAAHDDCPSVLSIDWPDNGEVDQDACEELMVALVAQGMAEAYSS